MVHLANHRPAAGYKCGKRVSLQSHCGLPWYSSSNSHMVVQLIGAKLGDRA